MGILRAPTRPPTSNLRYGEGVTPVWGFGLNQRKSKAFVGSIWVLIKRSGKHGMTKTARKMIFCFPLNVKSYPWSFGGQDKLINPHILGDERKLKRDLTFGTPLTRGKAKAGQTDKLTHTQAVKMREPSAL